MKRRVSIIGAGQAGLQLGLGLLKNGYAVKVFSDRDASTVRNGPAMSSQCMFDSSLEIERKFGLNHWERDCPLIHGIGINIAGQNGERALHWQARFDRPAQSVDQRLKFSHWVDLLVCNGGELLLRRASVEDLENETKVADLVIVASGKGALSNLFERNRAASPYDSPQRRLSMCYVHGRRDHEDFSKVSFNIIPGAGEYFSIEALTLSGPCDCLFFEAIPGGGLDKWDDVTSPEEHLSRTLELLERFLPWEADRCRSVKLTDPHAVLRGAITPTVRRPVAFLRSGAAVLGMGDAVVLNDPITGQGSNLAARCADMYLESILARNSQAFDEEWMQATFDRYWNYAQWTTGWSNAMLQPPPQHVLNVLGAAAENPAIASRFVNAFNNPQDFFPWIADPVEAQSFLVRETLSRQRKMNPFEMSENV